MFTKEEAQIVLSIIIVAPAQYTVKEVLEGKATLNPLIISAIKKLQSIINEKPMNDVKEPQTSGANLEGEANDGHGSQPTSDNKPEPMPEA